MTDKVDPLRRAFARLQAIRSAVQGQDRPRINEEFAAEYTIALNELTEAGFNVQSVRIPDEHLSIYSYQSNYVTKDRHYDKVRSVERAYFLMKIDTALGYFTFSAEERPIQIGFSPPKV